MLQNLIAGLQGVVDHILVGHLIGYTANAAIGVSWQIFLVVIVFFASLFTGQAVLVARYAGAGDVDKVNRTVQQAFLTAIAMYAVMGPVGYFAAPFLLELANASGEVRALALPFLRINFSLSIGMVLFFMITSALRAAGDAQTPLRLGIMMTVLNVVLNLILIPGLGPIPALSTAGSALGTVIASSSVSAFALYQLFKGRLVIKFSRDAYWRPDFTIIRALFRFGLPTGVQGIAMNVAGVFMLRFIGSLPQSAAAQAAFAIGYTELFSMITWTSVGLMGATAAVTGQNLGANQPDRAALAPKVASRIGLTVALLVGMHGVGLVMRRMGLDGPMPPLAERPPPVRQLMCDWARAARVHRGVIGEGRAVAEWSWSAYRILQAIDLLSLYLTWRGLASGERWTLPRVPRIPGDEAGAAITVTPVDRVTCALDPWPFAGDRVEAPVASRIIDDRAYPDPAALADALATAPRRVVPLAVVPA